ncbi:SAR2788 family putative toxin [Shouchella miscanthi]|uniref:SAR2788 family putative toxin n=1 Tax=Shouchella miscanthi TaxID=2598861 RepID=A0ABU6NQQ2_9BACI|nr:SAR2788 family putative toxin [Shouchella miscanthi]
MFNKILISLIVFMLLFSSTAPSIASAVSESTLIKGASTAIDISKLEQMDEIEVIELEENLEITEYYSEEISYISTIVDEEDIQVDTILTTNLETGDISINGQISDNDELIDFNFEVFLNYVDKEDFGGYLVDLTTGEQYIFDTKLADASAVPLVVIAVQIVRFGLQWAIKKYGKKVATNALNSSARLAANNVKKSLLNDTGVKIAVFTQKVKNKQEWKNPKSGWSISRDLGKGNSHGGSYYKLMNKSGKRIATLSKDGKILRQ